MYLYISCLKKMSILFYVIMMFDKILCTCFSFLWSHFLTDSFSSIQEIIFYKDDIFYITAGVLFSLEMYFVLIAFSLI